MRRWKRGPNPGVHVPLSIREAGGAALEAWNRGESYEACIRRIPGRVTMRCPVCGMATDDPEHRAEFCRAVAESSSDRCLCGHAYDDHGEVDAVLLSDGRVLGPTWVCQGGRLADVNAPDSSPWDHICGCVLHSAPPLSKVTPLSGRPRDDRASDESLSPGKDDA